MIQPDTVTLDTLEWLHLFFVRRLDSPQHGVLISETIALHVYTIAYHFCYTEDTKENAYCSVGEWALITVPSVGETAPYTSR